MMRPDSIERSACPRCGTELAPRLLCCPSCRRLVHAETLKALAQAAEEASEKGDLANAETSWQQALELLPPDSKQHAVITARLAALRPAADTAPMGTPPATSHSGWGKKAGILGALALLLWKFKVVAVFALTKAKLLLLGLTKASTFFSMALSTSVYASAWGWWFALGLVVSIYVHEMGHVAALRHYGIPASAPMFIPGLGAMVRLKRAPADAVQDARVGLAGPWWGLGAALSAYAVFLASGAPLWGAIARVGAWINLFNLLPLGPLDGGRAFRSLTRSQQALAAATYAAVWFLTGEGLLFLLLIAAGARTLMTPTSTEPDRYGLMSYVTLVVLLSALTLLEIPVEAPATDPSPSLSRP